MANAVDIDSTLHGVQAGECLRVRGLVQGVGFRPAVWRIARDCGLEGDVLNDAQGVLIRVWGPESRRARFRRRLEQDAPPLARIDAIESAPASGSAPRGFTIVASRAGSVQTGVVADAATCPDCLSDITAPGNRRYGYAFTNCTHCGPRLSIVDGIPYDRSRTSMRDFPMCAECRAEYDDPADRRFHAQPNACAACGPRLWIELEPGVESATDPLVAAAAALRAGRIVAIRGVGGVHLACDAMNELAVTRLRQRKRRYEKPFALMAPDLASIGRYCRISTAEASLLLDRAAPIVLLRARGEPVAAGVAPGQRTLGFMLPYSPLHHLFMQRVGTPIVLTSGNRSEEPQCTGNAEARQRLAGIADVFLLHDRHIVNRLDDSVVRIDDGQRCVLRRARGYAPVPHRLPADFSDAPPVLALGGELKNAFCLLRDGQAIVSQHLGDQEEPSAHAAFRETLAQYLEFYRHRPAAVAIDAHPEYLPSKFGREWAAERGIELVEVQHHHAHIAACLADNRVGAAEGPVLGIALDGLGFGEDGTLWGGEFLLADYAGFERVGSLRAVPMPGGARAIREPWRMAFAWLDACGLLADWPDDHPALRFLDGVDPARRRTLSGMLASDFNSPLTSSCGRLFDAVAAVLGIRGEVTYEGQAAIELEAAVTDSALAANGYHFAIRGGECLTLDPAPMWAALGDDLACNAVPGVAAARFHAGLAQAIADMAVEIARRLGPRWPGRVALSGGVFQNAILKARVAAALAAAGIDVLAHREFPANDGGLCLGQAVIAATTAGMEAH